MASPAMGTTCGTAVAVRVRPPSTREMQARCISTDGECEVIFSHPDGSMATFAYDRVLGEQ